METATPKNRARKDSSRTIPAPPTSAPHRRPRAGGGRVALAVWILVAAAAVLALVTV
ncbi:hypothetical protein [Nocardiopsis coralliicola]